jgi:hypothetical protein
MGRPLFVHVGCSKTGTSSLQAGLWESVEPLAGAGVGLPFVGRVAHLRHLLRPLGWRPVEGYVGGHDEAALARVVERLRATPGERLLVSNEDLAEVGADEAARVGAIAEAAGLDLHVIVTVRDWALQLPSEYQQFLKHSMSERYEDFLVAVRDGSDRWGRQFRRRQDPVDVLGRWGAAAPPERIHVIVVPPYATDPDAVFRMMGETAGFDGGLVVRPGEAVNASFGVVEAEVFRRVNAALAEPLQGYSEAYARAVRWPFAQGVLAQLASPRITLPPEHLGWVQEQARAAVAQVRSGAHPVRGDLDRLVPADDAARPMPTFDEAEVADAAISALARYAARSAAEASAAARKRRPPRTEPGHAGSSAPGWWTRLSRRRPGR